MKTGTESCFNLDVHNNKKIYIYTREHEKRQNSNHHFYYLWNISCKKSLKIQHLADNAHVYLGSWSGLLLLVTR